MTELSDQRAGRSGNAVAAPAEAGLVHRSLDSMARASLWLPLALGAYFLVRAAHLPEWLVPALALLYVGVRSTRARQSPASEMARRTPPSGDEVALFVLLVFMVVAPSVRLLPLATGSFPSAFLFSDDAYNLMIARGLGEGFPPVDLSYAGQTVHYHLGGPLLLEMLHRFTGLQYQAILYVLLPIALKLTGAACVYRILGTIFPDWRTSKKLVCLIASSGIFLVDPYNVLWNLRNVMVGGAGDLATIFDGMPIARHPQGFLDATVYYGAPLAAVFMVGLFANLDRSPVLLGVTLFAISLAKSSVFLPLGFGWGCYALYCAARFRRAGPILAGAVGLGLAVLAIGYSMRPGTATLAIGAGYAVDALRAQGSNAALAAGSSSALVALGVGALLMLASTHLFGVGALRTVAVGRPRAESHDELVVMTASMVASLMFAVFFVFRIDPTYQAQFYSLHEGVRDRLWIDFESYLEHMWKLSIGAGLIVASHVFAVLAAAGVLAWRDRTASGPARTLLSCATGLAVLVAFTITARQLVSPYPASMKVVSPESVAALSLIPVRGAVVLTNDRAYDDRVDLHLPLLNAWAPALFGHQFWAVDFMFGNTGAPDAVWRLKQTDWFWSADLDNARRDFLAANGITHLLVRRSLLARGTKDPGATSWINTVFEGLDYGVYSVADGSALEEEDSLRLGNQQHSGNDQP